MLNFIKDNIKRLFLLIFILAIVYWGYGTYQRHKELNKNNVPMVVVSTINVVPPLVQDFLISKSYVGKVEAINDADIIPYISGYVTEIKAKGGQNLRKGDIILVIKQDEYIANLSSTFADMNSANADFQNAKKIYERMKKAGDKAFSQTEMDNAYTTLLKTEANFQKTQAQFFSSQINFEYTMLRAPFDGTIGNISTSLGDYISPQSGSIAKLVQYSPIRVVFSITDKEYLNEIIKDSLPKIELILSNGKKYSHKGQLKYASNEVDISTNTVPIYAEFINPDHQLIPNAYVKVLLEKEYNKVIKIPKNLVIMKQDANYIYTIQNGIIVLHKINILADYEDDYIIANTFNKKEFIAIDEIEQDKIGQKVEISINTGE